jgi:peptide/nickel transport system permease protein/oligopeptide transport system permease protein
MSRGYLLRRLLLVVPVLLGTTFVIFAMVFALPGDPIRRLAGNHVIAQSTYNAIRAHYHLDQPFFVQYWEYVKGLAHFDLGETFYGERVSSIIGQRFPVTVRLTTGAFIVEVVLGLIAAFVAALRRGKWLDNFVLVSTLILITVPVFVLGFLGQLMFGVNLHWLPIAGVQHGWTGYVLPCLVLGVGSAAAIGRLARSNILDNLSSEHIKAATARGLPRRRVLGLHVLRNAMVPIVTILGLDLAVFMGGAPITESIFNLPGLGQELVLGIQNENGPVVVGLVTLAALIFILTNLAVDLLVAYLDPRIGYG